MEILLSILLDPAFPRKNKLSISAQSGNKSRVDLYFAGILVLGQPYFT
jgi:hypothetical protein